MGLPRRQDAALNIGLHEHFFAMKLKPNLLARAALCLGIVLSLLPKSGFAAAQEDAETEGIVIWYVAMPQPQARAISAAFEKHYPKIRVKAVMLRANEIPGRVTAEQRAGRFDADVVSASAWNVSALGLAGALARYTPPEAGRLVPAAVDKNHFWVGEYVLTIPIVYNTKTLAAQGLAAPKSYEDLTKPEYKAKFSIGTTDYEWYHGMVQALGQPFLTRLAANAPLFRDGHTTNLNGLIDGDFPISIGAYGYKAYAAARKNYPIVVVDADPTIAEFQLVGIAKKAPHPKAAEFFENWLISRNTQSAVQKAYQETPTRNDVPALAGVPTTKLTYSDPNAASQSAAYESNFNNTFHLNTH